MAKQKSLKVNFIMNAILTMSSFIFPLITFPYVSRILMPSSYQLFQYDCSTWHTNIWHSRLCKSKR